MTDVPPHARTAPPARSRDHNRPQAQSEDPWWDYAHGAAKALAQGREPPTQAVYGPLLEPNEVVRLNAPAHYSRLQRGATAQRRPSAPVMAYNPLLMAGSMAAQGIANSRADRRAAADAQITWRLQRPATVLTTNHRLMCSRPDGGWLSFWFQDLAEYHPDLTNRTVTMAFAEDQCAPLRLAGPAAPAIALWSALVIHGPTWKDDPRLGALFTPSTTAETTRHHDPHAATDNHRPEQQRYGGLPDEQTYQWAAAQAHNHRGRVSTKSTGGLEL